jgi:signal transduction histidine kinase
MADNATDVRVDRAGRLAPRWRGVLLAACVVSLGLTALAAGVPGIDLAFRSPQAHSAINTTSWLVCSFAVVLLYGRAGRSGSSWELDLMTVLALLAFADLAFGLIPFVVGRELPGFSLWAAGAARLLAAGGFAFAALAPSRLITCPGAAARRRILLALATVAGLAALAIPANAWSPWTENAALSPTDRHPGALDSPYIFGVQVTHAALYIAAALGFARRYLRERDALLRWVVAAMGLALLARVNYVAFPSLYSQWISTGDVFRVASSLALFAGIAREVRRNQDQLAARAVFDERRRLARDLHDSVAQDLLFIHGRSARLAESGVEPGQLARIAGAAERALAESRSAITALSRPIDEPLEATLEEVAREITDWDDVDLSLDVDEGLVVALRVREVLVRIVREAVTNAVRHSGASHIRIEATGRSGLTLRIEDDGVGFDAEAATRAGSFGLTSMRDRAESLGGTLEVLSRGGQGASVLVRLP